MEQERRQHRRLPIQLPLICRAPDAPERIVVRSKTVNVSTGGLYFETLSDEVRAGQKLELELTVPPGDGHFPYQGRVTADVRVIRVTELPAKSSAEGLAHLPRRGVAATFSAGLRLSF
ncbi:MAG: PilZ domain-containing protein [Phycisphaerae bacterium]|nr:PilZ domain-containing protein [Phycisphaerae bacterium]